MGDRRSFRWVLGTAGAVVLGAVFLVAAWAKALDPLAFAEQIRAEGLEWGLSAPVLAVLVVALEAGLGVALLLGVRRPWTLLPAAGLVALFLFLTGRAYWRWSHGVLEDSSCGCFGNLLSRTPAEAFWQDLLLLVPPLLLALLWRRAEERWVAPRAIAAGVAAALALVLAWKAPELPLDDLATRLRPGARLTQMCAGGGGPESVEVCLDVLVPQLAEGSHLVVVSDLENPDLVAGLERLNRTEVDGGAGGLWLLTSDPEEAQMAFFWTRGPAFEVREAPEAMLRPLYRTLPRSFRLEDGVVTETWAGLPPESSASLPARSLR